MLTMLLLLVGAPAVTVVSNVRGLTFVPAHGSRFSFPGRTPLTMGHLALNSDRIIRIRNARVFDPTTGTRILLTGASIDIRVALTPTGAAVDAALALTLTERAPGDFHGTLQGSDLDTHLRAHLGNVVYLVYSIGSGDFLAYESMRVVDGIALEG